MPRATSRRLLRDLPTAEEMDAIVSDLRSHGDQSMVMLGLTYLEHALEQFLRAIFKPLTTQEYNRLFDGSRHAVLGTFSSKIYIADAFEYSRAIRIF